MHSGNMSLFPSGLWLSLGTMSQLGLPWVHEVPYRQKHPRDPELLRHGLQGISSWEF